MAASRFERWGEGGCYFIFDDDNAHPSIYFVDGGDNGGPFLFLNLYIFMVLHKEGFIYLFCCN